MASACHLAGGAVLWEGDVWANEDTKNDKDVPQHLPFLTFVPFVVKSVSRPEAE